MHPDVYGTCITIKSLYVTKQALSWRIYEWATAICSACIQRIHKLASHRPGYSKGSQQE